METAEIVVFGVAEFESANKIRVEPFLGALGPIFARNFYISRDRLVPRAPWRHPCVSRRILHMHVALVKKCSKCPNPQNCPHYGKGIFFGRFIEFIGFCGNRDYCGFCGNRIKIRPRNMRNTIFRFPASNFCTKFLHNSRTVHRTDSGTAPSWFSQNVTYGCSTFTKILEMSKSSEMPSL